ncbi:DUF2059 domain-containing protein [Roseibacterium beibuensis]|uniref:DUF2059 domain-containing protein n=1 Tax=[Roseibacterium] beibuensis TaxID=1193142 RepID=UPI00217D7DC7|nr:DUF2059 domain-containing protein [Roseibacterium beibuensis]MCS6624778.1 DUF2059 domain-containing protein [Roseibacterium beibuensis]
MRFMIVCMAAAVAGSALGVAPARAAEVPQTAPPAPSARQLELTRRYIDLTMTDQFEESLRGILLAQAEVDPETRALPPEDRTFLAELAAELTTDMIPQMLDEMTPVYARAFTEAELEAMIEFYDSEMGRSIIRKTMRALPEATQAAMSVVPQMLEKMASRLCQHYGCTPAELEQLKREMRGEASFAPAPK